MNGERMTALRTFATELVLVKMGGERKFAISTSQKRAYSKHRHTAVCEMAFPPTAGVCLEHL